MCIWYYFFPGEASVLILYFYFLKEYIVFSQHLNYVDGLCQLYNSLIFRLFAYLYQW